MNTISSQWRIYDFSEGLDIRFQVQIYWQKRLLGQPFYQTEQKSRKKIRPDKAPNQGWFWQSCTTSLLSQTREQEVATEATSLVFEAAVRADFSSAGIAQLGER